MEISYLIIISLVGLSLGSLFNVIIFRFNTRQGFIRGRSKCLNCGIFIRWRDLVPVLSYLVLGGKCRNCRKKISPWYLLTELATALVVVLFFINNQEFSLASILNTAIILIFTVIFFIDRMYLIIPDKALILLGISIILLSILSGADLWGLLIAGLGLSSLFAILFIVSGGKWIGFGDIKLILLIGFLFGYPDGYLVIISAVWLATLISLIMIGLKKAGPKTEIPFGSFLALTSIIFIIFNDSLQKISSYFY